MDSFNTKSKIAIDQEAELYVGLKLMKVEASKKKEDTHLDIVKYILGRPITQEELDRVDEILKGLMAYTHHKLKDLKDRPQDLENVERRRLKEESSKINPQENILSSH